MNLDIERLLCDSIVSEKAGNMGLALQLAEQAIGLARAGPDVDALALALVRAATAHFRLGHYAKARNLAEQALTYAPPHSIVRADAVKRIGTCAAETNDLIAAEAYLQQAIDLYRELDSQRELFQTLHNLATSVYMPRGQFALSLAADEESFRMCVELGDPTEGTAALITIGYVRWLIGDCAAARVALEQLMQLVEPRSAPMGYHYVIAADVARDEEELERVPELLALARSIAESTGEPSVNILVRISFSRWHRMQGQAPESKAWASEAVAFAQRVGYRHFEGKALIERAQACWRAGDGQAAEVDLGAAFEVLDPLGAAFDLACVKLLLAALYREQHRPEAEETWLDAARRIRQGGYEFILERERAWAFPLVAAQLRSRRAEAHEAAEMLMEQFAHVPAPALHIFGLGRFEVRQGRRALPDSLWQRRKAGELVRYLLLQPQHSANRNALLEALWTDYSFSSAEALFHQATSALRRALEPELPDKFPSRYLEVEAERITLSLPPGSTVDFETFENQLTRALAEGNRQKLSAALEIYADDLYPQDRYADWASPRREHLAQLYLHGLMAYARMQLESNQPQAALTLCRRILDREPWHEDAVLIGMIACLQSNDRPSALRLYLELQERLHQDLDLAPRADLTQLAESLRA